MTLIVGLTIKFIDTDRALRDMLLVCRDFNDILKPTILKQALLRSDQHRIQAKRSKLWLMILKIEEQAVKSEFAKLSQQAIKLKPDIKSMIDVDINRSFNLMQGINATNLRKILTSYAVCNPELNYCQGMNFIAGFLFLLFQDEALSFAVMRDLIHRFNMGRLFNTELPMLKLNFYQLDRLISILLPDLHSHLKVSQLV